MSLWYPWGLLIPAFLNKILKVFKVLKDFKDLKITQ